MTALNQPIGLSLITGSSEEKHTYSKSKSNPSKSYPSTTPAYFETNAKIYQRLQGKRKKGKKDKKGKKTSKNKSRNNNKKKETPHQEQKRLEREEKKRAAELKKDAEKKKRDTISKAKQVHGLGISISAST